MSEAKARRKEWFACEIDPEGDQYPGSAGFGDGFGTAGLTVVTAGGAVAGGAAGLGAAGLAVGDVYEGGLTGGRAGGAVGAGAPGRGSALARGAVAALPAPRA